MNQGANLLTTPLARGIDAAAPYMKWLNRGVQGAQTGLKAANALTGQQQSQPRALAPPAPPPSIPSGMGMATNRPSPADIAAWNRVKRRQQLAQQQRGMMT
jgi:hypothetical protein